MGEFGLGPVGSSLWWRKLEGGEGAAAAGFLRTIVWKKKGCPRRAKRCWVARRQGSFAKGASSSVCVCCVLYACYMCAGIR
jgi:hypothetical protein